MLGRKPFDVSTRFTHLRTVSTAPLLWTDLPDRVPVVTIDGKARKPTLDVDRSHPIAESKAVDESRKARPFDRSILSKMSTTMRSFTLDGKVAIVTG